MVRISALSDQRQRSATNEQGLQPIIVAYTNGAPVMLSDVARVIDDVENTKLAAWMNKTPAIIVNIRRQPGANTIQVVDRIKRFCHSSRRPCRPASRFGSDRPHDHNSAPRLVTCSSRSC